MLSGATATENANSGKNQIAGASGALLVLEFIGRALYHVGSGFPHNFMR